MNANTALDTEQRQGPLLAGGKCPKGDNLECKNDICVEKPAACGDLDWPCCDEHGPEGAR